jgi:hypothetical protein
MRFESAALCAGLLAIGCAGKAPSAKPAPTLPSRAAAAQAPPAAPDLSPVTRPDNVVAIGRISRPGETIDRLAEWGGAGSFSDFVDELAPGLGGLAIADAPLDVVLSLERKPAGPLPDVSALISIGLESRQAVAEQLGRGGSTRRELGPGVSLLAGGRRPCAVAAAAGSAPVRLVCATSRAALDELLPYVTRGLAREPGPPDQLRVELDVERARALHGERIASLERFALPFARVGLAEIDHRLGRALGPLVSAISGELLHVLGDVDRIEATAKLAEAHVDLELQAILGRGAQSYFAQTLLELAPRQGPPPADFWKLPLDAHFAFHSHGMQPERADTLRRTLSGALSRASRHRGPRATLDLVVEALFPEPPFVYAFGLLEQPERWRPTPAERLRSHSQRVLGWHVIGVETDAKQLAKRLERGMDDYNKGPLRKLAYAEFPSLCPGLPKITRRAAPRAGLPAGAVIYEMLVPGKLFADCVHSRHFSLPAGNTDPLGLAVVLAPGKPRSWIVIAPDTDFAVAKLRTLLGGEASSRLESLRAELETPSLFGAVTSVELLGALRTRDRASVYELGSPGRRLAWRVSVDGPRALHASARVPREAFR